MADLRYDPIAGVWVAIARKRRERPTEFIPLEQLHQQLICPFCRGNEDETPGPIAVYDHAGSKCDATVEDWLCRVIPNKYPSLMDDSVVECGPYSVVETDGVQELVIPTPRHVSSISELTQDELRVCLNAARDRIGELRRNATMEHLIVFLNCRYAAGASLGHIHFQLMGAPVLSHYLAARASRNRQHFETHGTGLVQTLLQWELAQQKRIVEESENFVMICPFASRHAFQVWIVPRTIEIAYTQCSNELNAELALLCKNYVERLEQLLNHPAYNLLVNLGPRNEQHDFWFVEIFPRTNRAAGFELGTDVWVNPVAPETAVKRLRD